MAKVNNMVLVLTVLLLVISLFGTFMLMSNISFETPGGPVGQGEVKFGVLPEPGQDADTGYVGFKILPEES